MLNRRIRALVLAVAALGLLAVPVERGAARSGVYVSIWCNSLGDSRMECFGHVSGGSGNYYYNWTPDPLYDHDGYDYVHFACTQVYNYQTVYLTVTDLSTDATGSTWHKEFCGDAP